MLFMLEGDGPHKEGADGLQRQDKCQLARQRGVNLTTDELFHEMVLLGSHGKWCYTLPCTTEYQANSSPVML